MCRLTETVSVSLDPEFKGRHIATEEGMRFGGLL